MHCKALAACLLGLAFALPVKADVPSPQRDIRRAKVAQWHQKYPGTVPAVKLSLEPGGKTLAVHFEAKTPASYSVKLNGKPAARGAVGGLKGGTGTSRVPLDGQPSPSGEWVVHVDYSLKGVAARGSSLAETGDAISGCLRERFAIEKAGSDFVLRPLGLDGEDYFFLRGCGL